jgi:hypothetical protein
VLSGIVILIRTRVSIKMFESVRAASPWLARCVQLASVPELHEQVERGANGRFCSGLRRAITAAISCERSTVGQQLGHANFR